jgi:thioredoxin-like negative regulator of GroEL
MKKIIAFYAFWDTPSQTTVLKTLKTLKNNGVINCEFYDVDKEIELVKKYKVINVPTVIFTKDGNEYERLTGLLPSGIILDVYNQ